MSKIKATYVLHSIFITLFLFSIYHSFQSFLDCYHIINIKEYDWNAVMHTLALCHNYRVTLFLLIPLVGILIKNKLGWIFIATYIYFILINYVVQNGIGNIIFFSTVIIALLIILLLINTKTSILAYYKISPKNNITINTIALFLGASLSYLLIILRLY